MSNEDTVTVDGQEYVFDPEKVCKPQKTAEKQENIIFESGNP